MQNKKCRCIERLSLLLLLMLILFTFVACNDKNDLKIENNMASDSSIETQGHAASDSSIETLNQNTGTDSFDINVQINYRVTIDKNIKEINPNIIRATRQAIFDYDCSNAKFSHYNGVIINNDICVFEVNETGKNTWQVKFWEKPQNSDLYNKDGFCFATVEKQDSGSYKGYVINPGGPVIRGDETY
ncbi:hypothetical protein CLHUN_12930 [Ruminiclostridium hungatei]|uniref:Lipoprotein n=1 Tax=Ruminiclostridium hungatei TaxID=48256 RepID=A0A1V4SP81_RUMHU|nr:hypothetical protein [Ruminiclostridium hungatei]OPX45061.1 hypothetical protein CLHUN_12930 [Ruminiclostridium hungatei]